MKKRIPVAREASQTYSHKLVDLHSEFCHVRLILSHCFFCQNSRGQRTTKKKFHQTKKRENINPNIYSFFRLVLTLIHINSNPHFHCLFPILDFLFPSLPSPAVPFRQIKKGLLSGFLFSGPISGIYRSNMLS